MRILIAVLSVVAMLDVARAITTTLEYEDARQAADRQAATNYTDAAARAATNYTDAAARAATNYTDTVIAGLGDLAWLDSLSWSQIVGRPTTWAWSAITGKPSWIGTSKPTYSWSEISSKPSWIGDTKPSYTLNEVCPEVENWLGVPGTTAAGKSIKVLAKTVNGVIEGGVTVTGSSNNDNNTTKYRYGGVTATRSGVATDYLFDTSSQSGIVRRSELAGLATSQSVAAAAIAATNYTDSVANPLRQSLAAAASAATNYTDTVAATKADLNTYTTAEFTTNDLWLCEWSGEVLPFRSSGSMSIWQKAYNAKPALMYIKSPVAWQLNPTGSTLITITTTNATATALDFGSGYTLKRLTGPAHVVYRDELDRAIAAAAHEWSATNTTAVISYHYGKETVAIPSGGTLTANLSGWNDGVQTFVVLQPAGSYTVGSNIQYCGYGTWPTNTALCVAWPYGSTLYINPIVLITE